jgi:hypothetical protein
MGWNSRKAGEMAIRHEAIKQEIACSLKILSQQNRSMKTSAGKTSDQAIRFSKRVFLQARYVQIGIDDACN